MFIFSKDGKNWTCPDSSLTTIASTIATDKDDVLKDKFINNEIAQWYLEQQGFKVEHVADEEPITEVPETPNWYNRSHRDLYNRLFYQKMDRPLTEAEEDFCKRMYHAEEYAHGLDG